MLAARARRADTLPAPHMESSVAFNALTRTSRSVLLVCTMSFGALPAASAEENVLIESIPANVDKAAALASVRDALKYREWTIVAEDADSISATITRQNIDARIRIAASGSRLVYQESARGKPKLDYTGRFTPTATSTPSRWINYLKSDVSEKLMAHAAAPASAVPKAAAPAVGTGSAASGSSEPAVKRSSLQRLQELKEMLDKGLITADEYAHKKDEILKGL